MAVASIDEWWEDEEDRWKDIPVVRVTYQITLEEGQQLSIFKYMQHGGWYRLRGWRHPEEPGLAG